MSVRAICDVFESAPADWDPLTRLVALALGDCASRDGSAYPSLRYLQEMTGLGERALQRHLRILEGSGWVRRLERHTESGRQTSNLWIWVGPTSGLSTSGEGVSGDTGVSRDGGRVSPETPSGVSPETPSIDEPFLGTVKRNPVPAGHHPQARYPQQPRWDAECAHGAPYAGRNCIDCRRPGAVPRSPVDEMRPA